jgi:hypothetical protein
VSDEAKPGQQQLITLKNGALVDPVTRRIVANPGGGKSAITPANTSEFARLRAEKYRREAAAGMVRAVSASGSPAGTPAAAWGWIVEQQTALAGAIDKGRSSTEAARFVGSAIGILGGPKEAETGQNAPGGVVPGAILRGLLADLRLLRDQLGEDESG